MKRYFFFLGFFFLTSISFAQTKQETATLDEAISNCLECSVSISSNIETTTCLKL